MPWHVYMVCVCVWARAFASRRSSIIGFAKLQGGDCTFEVIARALQKMWNFGGVKGRAKCFLSTSSRDFMILPATRQWAIMLTFTLTHICEPLYVCSRSRWCFFSRIAQSHPTRSEKHSIREPHTFWDIYTFLKGTLLDGNAVNDLGIEWVWCSNRQYKGKV